MSEMVRKKEIGKVQPIKSLVAAARESAVLEIAKARELIVAAEELIASKQQYLEHLEEIEVMEDIPSDVSAQYGPQRYLRMELIDAIETFLRRAGKPQSRDSIRDEMIAGGAVLGKRQPEGNIKKSIDWHLEKSGRLVEIRGGLIWLADQVQEKGAS